MSLLKTKIPGALPLLGVALVGAGPLMYSMVKLWSLRIWLPIIFGIGVALSGWLSRFRSQDLMMSFRKGIQLVVSSPGGKVAMKQDIRLSSSASHLRFAEAEAPSSC